MLSRDQADPDAPEEERRVVAVYRHTVYDLRDVTVTGADGRRQTLDLTPGHKVYVVRLGWTEAGSVVAGERMLQADGSETVVTANLDDARPSGVTVYNFQVEGDHTYFVSTFSSAYADGAVVAAGDALWVHNSCVTPNEVTSYRSFKSRSVEWDSLDGHELLQFGYLKNNGYAKGLRRAEGILGDNPVIALDSGLHEDVYRLQKGSGLLKKQNLKKMSAIQNIAMNADILRTVGVAEVNVQKLVQRAMAFVAANGIR